MSTLFLVEALKEGFIGILLTLDTLIYGLIGSAFKIFMALAGARLLSSDTYFEIANKIYVVVGVLMLFVLAYAILRGIIDPDQASKGEFGPKMIKNVVIAVLGLALAPTIFNLMYQGQGLILEQDVLGKLFFRIDSTDKVSTDVGDVNPDEYVKQIGGSVTATSLWQAFFHPAPDSGMEASDIKVDASGYFLSAAGGALACGAGIGVMAAAGWTGVGLLVGGVIALVGCSSAVSNTVAGVNSLDYSDLSLADAYNLTAGGETFGIYTAFLANYADEGEIEYLFGISTVAGAFALYAFISFSIDMGIRAAKLAYLQIIAPVPLVMQVLPKFKENFKKYTGSVISTFLEVFIRISVVYVVVYIICHLSDMFSSADALWGNADLSASELLFAYAFLILGLIAFCRKAPEMITQTLGIPKGDMHLGIGKKLAAGGAFSAGSVAYGGVTSAVRNWNDNKGKGIGKKVTSALGGMGSGMWRATRENFIGPNHKEAQTLADLKNVGERAAQGATDARIKRDDRKANHAEAVKAVEAAKAKREAAEAAYNASHSATDEAKLKQAIDEYNDAVARVGATTALGSFVDNLADSMTAWSVGTVSTEKEEADMKFSNALKKLRDVTREEAYKPGKCAAASAYKAQLAELQSKKISEYREGYDAQVVSSEIEKLTRKKIDEVVSNDSTVRAKKDALVAATHDLDIAKSALAAATHDRDTHAGDPAYETAYNTAKAEFDRLNSSRTTLAQELSNARAAAESSISSADLTRFRNDATTDVVSRAKKTADEILAERKDVQRQIKVTQDLMEAAADEYVARAFANNDGAIVGIYQSFLNEQQDYIANNPSHVVFDGNNPLQMIAEFTGDGRNVDTSRTKDVRSFVIEGKTNNPADDITYKLNSSGTYDGVRGDGTAAETGLTVEEVFEKASNLLSSNSNAEFRADTATTVTSKRGKKAAEGIPVSKEYIEKLRRKRKVDDAKSGKK